MGYMKEGGEQVSKMFYVVDDARGFTVHQGTNDSCREYIQTCIRFYGHGTTRYFIAANAKQRDLLIKQSKSL